MNSLAPTPTETVNKGIVAGSAVILACFLAWIWAAPSGPFVLVIATPSASEANVMSIITDADGSFVSGGSRPWFAVAYSDTPYFPARLRKAGAVLVLNANLKSICSQETFQ